MTDREKHDADERARIERAVSRWINSPMPAPMLKVPLRPFFEVGDYKDMGAVPKSVTIQERVFTRQKFGYPDGCIRWAAVSSNDPRRVFMFGRWM